MNTFAPRPRLPASRPDREKGPASTGRLFLALWPDAGERLALLAWQRALAWPATARLTAARDLHLTLVFIGELPLAQLPAVKAAAAAVPAHEAELTLDELHTWRGGTVVLAASQPPPALIEWQHALVQALAARGVPVDARAFHPHVTLARKGQGVQGVQGVQGAPGDRGGSASPDLDPVPGLLPVTLHARGVVLAARQGAHYATLWPDPPAPHQAPGMAPK